MHAGQPAVGPFRTLCGFPGAATSQFIVLNVVPSMAEDDESKSLLSIDDLSGLGGVAKKAIGAIEKAVGRSYRPRAIRKEAAAEADAKRYLAKGEADANKIIAEGETEIRERANLPRHTPAGRVAPAHFFFQDSIPCRKPDQNMGGNVGRTGRIFIVPQHQCVTRESGGPSGTNLGTG